MTWVDAAIADFCRSLGMEVPGFGGGAALRLHFEHSGTLMLEHHEGTVVVHLARALIPPVPPGLYRQALALCQPRHGHPFDCAAGLYGEDALVFLIRIPDAAVTLPALQQALEMLLHLHDDLSQNPEL